MRRMLWAVVGWGILGAGWEAPLGQCQDAAPPAVPAQGAWNDDDGRPRLPWTEAHRALGRRAIVSGQIVRIGHARGIHFLNFDPQRRDVFQLVIFEPALAGFAEPLEALYQDRWVEVRGWVTSYRGVPQIQISEPSQIKVLPGPVELLPVDPPAEPVVGDELTVASFNVRNLFDHHDDPYRADEGTPEKPRPELEAAAAAIRELNADVLALVEIENRGLLERFVETFLADLGYREVVLFEGNDLRGIDVGMLSRIPLGPVTSHRHLRFPGPQQAAIGFSRDVLRVELRPEPGEPFEVWVVHLKSNSDGREYAEPRRLAEAQALRGLLDERLAAAPDAPLVVCGDFNDTETSPTLATIVGAAERALASGWAELPADQRVTYNLEPYRNQIDFILWSPGMRARYVPGSYRIRVGELDELGSDHCPVAARFRREGP